MTRYQLHCHTWKDGCGSEFCDGAKKVFYRGDIPADIVFVGEAPGKSENSAGIPFHPGAPAGKLLMYIIKRSVIRQHKKELGGPENSLVVCSICHEYEAGLDNPCKPYRVGFTNVVSCIPCDPDSTEKLTETSVEQTQSCKPRLEEIISIANPRLIVAVGKVAETALARGYLASTKIPAHCQLVSIVHPAWIIRQTTAFQGLEVQRCCLTIKDAIHQLENPPKKSPTQKKNSGIVPHPIADYDDLYSVDGTAPY